MTGKFDFAIIGAGIAGASVASLLAGRGRAILLERETQPGYHTTGRSAAQFSETYGPPGIRALTRASAGFFHNPPSGFSATQLLTRRPTLLVARHDQMDRAQAMLEELGGRSDVDLLDAAAALADMPLLRADYVAAALRENNACDIDVHALLQGYLRRFRDNGGALACDREIQAVERAGAGWRIATRRGEIEASIIVNAAGAWADELAELAGARRVGLTPKRRTIAVVAAPPGAAAGHLPMVVDIDEQFYLKPETGRLLISPADETPSPPCDAQPDEYDIAVCVDRIETAFDLRVGRIDNKWSGLRSFVADREPVVGFDPQVPGFFWLAGQGGYGIQTAPAMARLAAALALGEAVPDDLIGQGVTSDAFSPGRMQKSA